MSKYVLSIATDETTATRLAEAFDMLPEPADAIALYEENEEKGIWSLSVYFQTDPGEENLRSFLQTYSLQDAPFTLEALPQEDWVAMGLKELQPVIGGRYRLFGDHDADKMPFNLNNIAMNAGQAFGTGHHGTTKGCLMALDRLLNIYRFDRVLDLGTGTGVLAIAVAKTQRTPVLASDIDPISVEVADENVALNEAGPYVVNVAAVGFNHKALRTAAPYDLIIANILPGPLKSMAADMRRHAGPSAFVVLSGILEAQVASVIACYRSHGFYLVKRTSLEGWVTLVLRKA